MWALIAMCNQLEYSLVIHGQKRIFKNIRKNIFENAWLLSKFSKIKPFENFPLYGISLTQLAITWIKKQKKSSNPNLQLHNIEIPEVTYNYREYREPLIDDDYISS